MSHRSLRSRWVVVLLAVLSMSFALSARSAVAAAGKSLFNGKDLTGWTGDPRAWSVKDGVIVGTTHGVDLKANTFLVWQGGEVGDFELTLKCRVEGNNNSGVQYRSSVSDPKLWRVVGYQCDIHPSQNYMGMLYGEGMGRGIIAQRGQKVTVGDSGKPKVVGEVGDQSKIDMTKWNEFTIIARGNKLVHKVNGVVTMELEDNHPSKSLKKGVIALQVHRGAPMKAYFKDITLKALSPVTPVAASNKVAKAAAKAKPAKKKSSGDPKAVTDGPKPKWVWSKQASGGQKLYLHRSFDLNWKGSGIRPASAVLTATCDNRMKVIVNGQVVAQSTAWERPVTVDVRRVLNKGRNVIAVEARNDGGVAAFALALRVEQDKGGKPMHIVTDREWVINGEAPKGWDAADYKPGGDWKASQVIATMGAQPWGNVFAAAKSGGGGSSGGSATPEDAINLPEGFAIEKLYNVPKGTHGSWVALTVGPNGELYASDQGIGPSRPALPPAIGSDGETKVEKLPVNVSNAQGMVWAFDSLYVNRNGGGVWRVTDANNDGELDKADQLVDLRGGGEHGPHAIILDEKGEGLYFVGGNHTNIPPDLTGSRQPMNWSEDLLLPRQWDARGHARGKLAPGGWVAWMSPDGKKRELISNGFRNEYDIALNAEGEMFTFDSDMEWDFGTPWYRPTRVNHVVSGSEFGWRSGTGKWPTYYPDSLPATVDIGPASPTGVLFGTGAKFPAKWQKALYILDWTYGTIWAVNLKPNGASYDGEVVEFVSGKPLPVTDGIVGKDGAFYFTVGGRGTQSALYRVTYTGDASTAPAAGDGDTKAAAARKLRRQLEAFHGKKDSSAVGFAWKHLGSDDRFIRYAARIAIEHQPVEQWKSRVLSETDPTTLINGAVALARQGKADAKSDLIAALNRIDIRSLSETQKLELLRAYALTFIRLGKPTNAERDAVVAKLDPLYPANSDDLNRELSRVLVYLRAPKVIDKTMKLLAKEKTSPKPNWATVLERNGRYGGAASKMLADMPPLQGLHYAFVLRNLRNGWTLSQRRAYYEFLQYAEKKPGGASYAGFINNIRKEAMANTSNAELKQLTDVTGKTVKGAPDLAKLPRPKGPGKDWKLEEVVDLAAKKMRKRNFENGKKAYQAVLCAQCHRFDGFGGDIGPDLSSVGNKFSVGDLIESIIDPSKVISDQYESTVITKKDGNAVLGRIVAEDEQAYHVSANPLAPNQLIKVAKSDVAKMEPSKLSAMPPKLINALNEQELLDLIAYLRSGGNRKDRAFK